MDLKRKISEKMIKKYIRKSEKIIQLLEFLVVAKIQSYYYETAKLEEFLVVAKYKATTMKTRPRGQSSISSTLEIIEDKKMN